MNFDEIMVKIKDGAAIAAETAGHALANAKKSTEKALEIAALNTKIRRLKLNIGREFMSIGKLVYETHLNPDASSEGIDEILASIDGLNEELDATVEERDRRKAE